MNAGETEAVSRLLDPQIEWVIASEHPETGTLKGQAALAEYQRDWQQTLPDLRIDLDELIDAGPVVVAVGTIRGTGSGSGVGVGVPIAFVFNVRDGLITRVEEYLDAGEALRAAGLPPTGAA